MSFASRNVRVVATVSILTACAAVACVPPLPGGALDDGAGNSTGAGGASGAGGGAASGPGIGGAAGMASGGSGPSPFLLVPGARPQNLAVDSKYAYWSDLLTGSIMKSSVQGGEAPVTLAQATGSGWVAVDSTGGVYWTSVVGTTLMKLGSDGVTPTPLATDTRIAQIIAGEDAIFWIANDLMGGPSSRVMKVSRNGGAPTVLASGQDGATAIALDATNVYWSRWAGGKVMKVGVSGGDPIELAASANISTDYPLLSVDTTSVYWVDSISETVMKVGIEGGQPEPAVVAPIKATSGIVDASGVYWTDPLGTVFVASGPNSVPRSLGSAGAGPARVLAVDATSVYWFDASARSIFRAPK